ncbi:MAG: excinuclease ABC subunit UvrA [Deltaproteobacteria bacterium]|nr:excinuclease ABC subunit UvrA [Deltaproteobacteria bacterium]
MSTPVAEDRILIRGAREHNLRIPELILPKNRLVVFTGVSGSGKSSLAFDTLYAEGQRRYVESLSSYARQFLGQMEKPKVDRLSGLSPTIAIEQKTASANPRSTVGTITEIYDYLRVLYARAGDQHCHLCGRLVAAQSLDQIVESLEALPAGTRLQIAAPIAENRKGEYKDVLADLRRRGFARLVIDGTPVRLDDGEPTLSKKQRHTIDLVVDRVQIGKTARSRLTDSIETALAEGKGALKALREDDAAAKSPKGGDAAKSPKGGDAALRFSQERACASCGVGFPELSPQSFSFNTPVGMCVDCNGLGVRAEMDPDLVVPDPTLSIRQGAIEPWATVLSSGSSWTYKIVRALSDEVGIDLDKPWAKLTQRDKSIILYGTGVSRVRVRWNGRHGSGSFAMRFEGVLNTMMRRLRETRSEMMREHYRKYFSEKPCRACGGARLRPESGAVLFGGQSIVDVTRLTVAAAQEFFDSVRLEGGKALVAEEVLKEVHARLGFLLSVGLEYLTLDRLGPSLSGGEAQRIRLASQLGAELSGVLYVLDEPSIGLHQRDNLRLIATLRKLRDLGNTVIVVEHDRETIESADHVVDFGPGAGRLGGEVVFSGPPADLAAGSSLTGGYISGRERIPVPARRREGRGEVAVLGAAEHNLRQIDARFPLGVLVAVTGVSGAGKSSLVRGILYPALMRKLHGSRDPVGTHLRIEGAEQLDKVIHIDQQPIGRTPRSNPATYTKAFDVIRDLYAQTPDARAAGYAPGRFSFNVRGGRCDACEGDGVKRVEMHFLPDVWVSCDTCRGKRYNEATLRVRYKGKTIADVLETSVADALELFGPHPILRRILQTLVDVGLDYSALGQSAPTLSGGEAQRVKLSRELAKRATGRTLYVLDEPTTGLHFDDIRKLLAVLHRLVDAGNTVVVIEHNLDVIRNADHVIDLGPEGGSGGGSIVAQGTPEQVARVASSHTGRYLRGLAEASTVAASLRSPTAVWSRRCPSSA